MPTATTSRRKVTAVTVRNLPSDVHRALKLRAKEHGISTEAEIRLILRRAVADTSQERISLADALSMPGAEDVAFELPKRTRYKPSEIDW